MDRAGNPRFLSDWASNLDVDLATNVAELEEVSHVGLSEPQSHRIRLAELCLSRGIDCDTTDSKRFAVELMGLQSGQEKVWFQLLDRMSDRFVRELESTLGDDWDSRKRRVLFGLLKSKCEQSGDTEGLLRLLNSSLTEELSLIVPALLRVSGSPDSQAHELIMTELDNSDTSPEAGLGTDQSSRWRAKLGLVAYGLEEWERVDRVVARATDPRSRSYFIYWFKYCEFSIEPLLHRFREFNDEWRATAAIGCIASMHNQIVSDRLRTQCVEMLSEAYQSHPSVGVHNDARKLLVAMGQVDVVQSADSRSEVQQIREDRNWYLNSQGIQMNVVRGPVEFWYGMPVEGKRPGRIHCLNHSFAISDQLVNEKEYAEFDPAMYPQPSDAKATGANWFEAVRYCDWMSLQEGLTSTKSLESEDEVYQRYAISEAGYRLPSTWEWECFFRDGTRTSFRFGESDAELFSTFRSTIETYESEWTSTTYRAFAKKTDPDLLQLQDLMIVKGGVVSITNTILPLGENRLHRADQRGHFGFRLAITLPPTLQR